MTPAAPVSELRLDRRHGAPIMPSKRRKAREASSAGARDAAGDRMPGTTRTGVSAGRAPLPGLAHDRATFALRRLPRSRRPVGGGVRPQQGALRREDPLPQGLLGLL